jgi:hypothetical protein
MTGMRCWVCSQGIRLHDIVGELPLAETLVHESCFARETGHAVAVRLTLSDYLRHRPLAA